MSQIGLKEAAETIRDLGQPVIETGCKLIEDLLGEPCRVAGGMIADQIYSWQWSNRLRIASKAVPLLGSSDSARQVMPAGFFLTFLDAAGNIEEPSLQDLWAKLLASAVDDGNARVAFVKVLEQLASEEAEILREVYSSAFTPCHMTYHLGETYAKSEVKVGSKSEPTGLSHPIEMSLLSYGDHLASLGLIVWEEGYQLPHDQLIFATLGRTMFGFDFVEACCGPLDSLVRASFPGPPPSRRRVSLPGMTL